MTQGRLKTYRWSTGGKLSKWTGSSYLGRNKKNRK